MFLSNRMHWDFALILILLATVVPWLGRRRVRLLLQRPSTTRLDRLSLYASTIAFQSLAAAIILWRTAHYAISASQLGLAIPQPFLVSIVAAGLSLLLLVSQLFSLRRFRAHPEEMPPLMPHLASKIFPQDSIDRLAFFALVLTVAVCEELIYRGFAQRVFQDATRGNIFIAILASSLLFSLAHLYQGRRGLISTFILGALFAIARALTDSLVPSITAHFVTDIIIGLLAPIRLHGVSGAASQPGPLTGS
jgi:uncharacterized protein